MNPCVLMIFSLLLLCIETTTANEPVAVRRGGGDDNDVMIDINKCLDKEREALLHFKVGLLDPDGILSTWRDDDDDDCCHWTGVMCHSQKGHVIEVDLSSNYKATVLVGEISHSLVNLSHLNRLDLSYNSFHGAIPIFIGSMTELRYLDLSYNSLYGIIPPEFENLTNLQQLLLESVGRCRVENLEWLSHLSHLEKVAMDGISLAKANYWVNVVSSLRNLSYLSLQRCELSQVMYPYSSFLNSSSSIAGLSLGNNNLTSSLYRWLYPLTSNKLSALDLAGNMLDGIPKYLGNLCSLEVLKISINSAVVKFPNFLKNLSGCTSLTLQVLYAPTSQFTGSLSDEIQKFSLLEVLTLSKNQLNGNISENLWELPRLQVLNVSFNYLRGAISENIGMSKIFLIDLCRISLQGVPSTYHMSNLSYVEYSDMSSCKLGPHFPKWIQKLKNLTYLNIADNTISDTIPVGFWDMWPSQLGYLNLSANNITGIVPDLVSKFDNNSAIDLSSNNFYGPIPNVSSTLAILNLSRNKFHGEISFVCQIVDGFLEFLDLSHNFLTGQLPDCLGHFCDNRQFWSIKVNQSQRKST